MVEARARADPLAREVDSSLNGPPDDVALAAQ